MKLYRIGNHPRGLLFSDTPGNYEDKNKTILLETKSLIDACPIRIWEKLKKQHNDYEYVYTSSRKEMNVCSIVPVSRSYFKLYEMIVDFHLLNDNISCACLAEGPGGFIHCLNDYSYRRKLVIHKLYGITLYSCDKRIPYWNQSIIRNKKNILSYGKDGTGDLYLLDNVKYFINEIGEDLCHLVTADGGFDYSGDYNQQEISSYKLLFSEIYIALHIQKLDGNFVLKVFDLFNYQTIQLIYLLYTCYSIIEFYKPSTSRLSNSEKYIICSGYRGCSDEIKQTLTENFMRCEKLNIRVPESFLDEIGHYNKTFTENQIIKIKEILDSDKKEDIQLSRKGQVEKARKWCEFYELPINETCIHF